MGHREQLLDGAKRCLLEKGFARTTARDIVAASGTNLGSIGYHFGTKDALMNAALMQATEDWGTQLERVVAEHVNPADTPLQRFESAWTRVIEMFEEHRALWVAQFEVFGHLRHSPELRPFFSEAQESARHGLATMLRLVAPDSDAESARTVGSFTLAILTGVVAQWLVDPERTPNGRDLADAIRMIAGIQVPVA